jgi:hypothetical protein
MIGFVYDKMVLMVPGAFGLLLIARDRIESIAQSIDGAQLSKHLSFVMSGFTVNDYHASCTITKW